MKRREFFSLCGACFLSLYSGSFASELSKEDMEEKPYVYLTVDDGPTRNMRRILDELGDYNHATFFLRGDNLRDSFLEGLAREAVERGHSLGNHSYSHPSFSKISIERAILEVKKCEDKIQAIYDSVDKENPLLFRFPYEDHGWRRDDKGKTLFGSKKHRDAIKNHLTEKGYLVIDDDIDTLDWKYYIGERKLETVLKSLRKTKSGDIILMHDRDVKGKKLLVNEAIRLYAEMGFSLVSLKRIKKPQKEKNKTKEYIPKKLVSIIEGPV